MKTKIKNHFEKEYSSSPHDVSDEEIDFIIENDCKCSQCGESIFELYDFPEIDIEKDILLCENCYDNEYRDTCSICEELYDKEDLPKEFPMSPFYYIGNEKPSGIYHALRWPVFLAATGGLGDTIIFWHDVEFVCSMEDFLKSHDPEMRYDFSSEWKEFLEDNNVEYANFIGSCCYEEALKIKNNKTNDNKNRT